jgi:hypothetical protein
MKERQWDIFLAHSSSDKVIAEKLYNLLEPQVRVFLDAKCLLPGDNWDTEIADAQQNSSITVVIISSTTTKAYYQREEVATAISMARDNPVKHRVVPLFLGNMNTESTIPYGLRLKHSLTISKQFTINEAARTLENLVLKLNGNSIPTQVLPSIDDAILLTKIINPPKGEDIQECTIWLNSRGNTTFIIDSITIEHLKGNLFSGRSGAILPDADYRFPFEYNCQKTHALKPALALSNEDPRPVSFTLSMAPSGVFSSSGGAVRANLHFHTPEGKTGTLKLIDATDATKWLPQLLQKEVEIMRDTILTPVGIQRGVFDTETDENLLKWQYPITIPYLGPYPGIPTKLPDPAPKIELTKDRLTLNKAIEEAGVLPQIIERARSHNPVAFDILSGLQNEAIVPFLLNLSSDPDFFKLTLHTLTIRHYVWPNEFLALFILDNRIRNEQFNEPKKYTTRLPGSDYPWPYCDLKDSANALIVHPFGFWARALIRLASLSHSIDRAHILNLLYLRRTELQDEQCSIIETICSDQLNTSYPEEIAVQFLLWLGWDSDKIRVQLQETLIANNNSPHLQRHLKGIEEKLLNQ